MLNKIILVRHAESEKDKRNTNRDITTKGRKQAINLAKKIKGLVENRKAEITSSSTVRAVSTAKIIADSLGVPYSTTFTNFRVENIDLIKEPLDKRGLTFEYIRLFEKGKLPKGIPDPRKIVNRFLRAVAKIKDKNVLIIVGHAGALETFAIYQDKFIPEEKLERELEYAEFIVLNRSRW